MTIAAAIREYESLTFPSLRQQAQSRRITEPLITMAASHQGTFIGLALADVFPRGDMARVLSLFVAPEHRGKGVGSTMLAHLEGALAREGCRGVRLAYRADWPAVPAIEHLLEKHSWNAPRVHMQLYKASVDRVMEAPWIEEAKLPEAFSIFSWSELTPEEREAIQQRQADEEWFPRALTPFQAEENMEPLNSLGLRYEGQVAGWMITHRIAPDTIQYTSLFIEAALQRQGRALPLLAEAIRRHAAAREEVPNGIFQVAVENEAMIKFVEHYLQPYMTSTTELRRSRRALRPGAAR